MMMDEYMFKIPVLGPAGCGKSTFVRRLCEPQAEHDATYTPTVGVEFSSHMLTNLRPNILVRVQLWDVAGVATYAPDLGVTVRNAVGLIAVADSSRPETIEGVISKVQAAFGHLPHLPTTSVLILLNKSDVGQCSEEDVLRALTDTGLSDALIVSGCTLTGAGVDDAIGLLCNRILDKVTTSEPAESASKVEESKSSRKAAPPAPATPSSSDSDVEVPPAKGFSEISTGAVPAHPATSRRHLAETVGSKEKKSFAKRFFSCFSC